MGSLQLPAASATVKRSLMLPVASAVSFVVSRVSSLPFQAVPSISVQLSVPV